VQKQSFKVQILHFGENGKRNGEWEILIETE
jgi:hypothetical protein